jgi:hypothetical protein
VTSIRFRTRRKVRPTDDEDSPGRVFDFEVFEEVIEDG